LLYFLIAVMALLILSVGLSSLAELGGVLSFEEGVEVVRERFELFAERLLVVVPVLQGLETVEVLTKAEHVLCLLAAKLLLWPRGFISEVKKFSTSEWFLGDEKMTVIDGGVGAHLLEDRVHVGDTSVDLELSQPVIVSGPAGFFNH